MEKKYKYLGYVMMLLLPLVFAAFYQSYFKTFPHFSARIFLYDHVHAFFATIWVLLLIVQPILISRRQYAWHRRLGRLSYFIFPLLVLSFIPREIRLINSDEPKDIFFPVADTLVLVPLYLLAIYNKRNVAKHMRYMIASALVLLGPTIGRIGPIWFKLPGVATQNIQYSVIYAILIGLVVYDKNLKKSRPYFVAMALFFLHQMVFYVLYL